MPGRAEGRIRFASFVRKICYVKGCVVALDMTLRLSDKLVVFQGLSWVMHIQRTPELDKTDDRRLYDVICLSPSLRVAVQAEDFGRC